MLSYFEVFTTSGIVLFSQDLASSGRQTTLINNFVKDVFIEGVGTQSLTDGGAADNPPYRQEKNVLRWTVAKDLGLVFVAVYQSLVQLDWVNKLLDNLKTIFCELYRDEVRNPYASTVGCSGFKVYFEQQVRELDGLNEQVSLEKASAPEPSPPTSPREEIPPPNPGLLRAPATKSIPTSTDVTPIVTPDTSRPGTPGSSVLVGSGGPKGSRRARKAAHAALNTASTPASSGDESKRKSKTVKAAKKGRRWDADGMADEEDDVQLDYSAPGEAGSARAIDAVDATKVGTRTKDGFLLNDMDVDYEVHSILRGAKSKNNQPTAATGLVGSGLGKISNLFSGVLGGKLLTKEALDKPIRDVEKLLIEKNVAREVAVQICSDVQNHLLGSKTGSFESVEAMLRSAVTSSLQRLLTPTSSLDILRDIASATTTANGKKEKRPWVASLLGVNGCGKSTHLSKIAYFCLQNRLRILVAAGDSFRAGAIEQLRVHVRNLSELCEREGAGYIELFEKGYGQDAAIIAKQAVQYATAQKFDIVLVDTAGRQSNSHLMGSLEKFVQMVQPDAIWLVAEAVVGSDSVNQARRFNESLGRGRKIDGYIISKCDVVDDMIGTIVNMVVTTSTPAVFLGVGQHYGDLRAFSATWATNLLLR